MFHLYFLSIFFLILVYIFIHLMFKLYIQMFILDMNKNYKCKPFELIFFSIYIKGTNSYIIIVKIITFFIFHVSIIVKNITFSFLKNITFYFYNYVIIFILKITTKYMQSLNFYNKYFYVVILILIFFYNYM